MTTASHGFPERPLIGVGAIVFRGDAVLMVRRAKPPRQGEWSLPGGRQRLGETVFAAAEREVLEETAATVRATALVDVVDFIDRDPISGAIRFHYTLVDVVADWVGGALRPGDDAAEAAWIPRGRIIDLDIWAETKRVVALAAARRGLDPSGPWRQTEHGLPNQPPGPLDVTDDGDAQ